MTAAHCARTLIAASASGNVLLRCCVKKLMPALIEYIAKMVPLVSDGSISESHATAINEVWKAFAIFFGSLAEAARMYNVAFIALRRRSFVYRNSIVGRLVTNYQSSPCQFPKFLFARCSAKRKTITLICNHVARCFQRSSFQVGCRYTRTLGAVSSESCRRKFTGSQCTDLRQTTDISTLILIHPVVYVVYVPLAVKLYLYEIGRQTSSAKRTASQ